MLRCDTSISRDLIEKPFSQPLMGVDCWPGESAGYGRESLNILRMQGKKKRYDGKYKPPLVSGKLSKSEWKQTRNMMSCVSQIVRDIVNSRNRC